MEKNQVPFAVMAMIAIVLLVAITLSNTQNSITGAAVSAYYKCIDNAYPSETSLSPLGSRTRDRARSGVPETYGRSNAEALQSAYDCRREMNPGGKYWRPSDYYTTVQETPARHNQPNIWRGN